MPRILDEAANSKGVLLFSETRKTGEKDWGIQGAQRHKKMEMLRL